MQVTDESLLAKYNLKANDAILAEGKQKEMWVDRTAEMWTAKKRSG